MLRWLVALVVLSACKRAPGMLEAPAELQRCVPAGDVHGSVVEVRFGPDGHGAATHGCFSTSHDATCIKQFVERSSHGEPNTTQRMLVTRRIITRPSGASIVGKVTFGEVSGRPVNVLGPPCAMHPL